MHIVQYVLLNRMKSERGDFNCIQFWTSWCCDSSHYWIWIVVTKDMNLSQLLSLACGTWWWVVMCLEFRLASTESVVCLLRWVERHMAGREQKPSPGPSPDTTKVWKYVISSFATCNKTIKTQITLNYISYFTCIQS